MPEAYILILTNQYSTDEQNLERKIGQVENKIPAISGLVNTAVLKTKKMASLAKWLSGCRFKSPCSHLNIE